MDEIRLIQCPCGQESQLVLLGDKWHYDQIRHGNGEPCGGLCFNCRAPLKDDELFPAAPAASFAKQTAGAESPEPVDVPEVSMSMTRDELVEIAEAMGLEVPKGAKKADIIELIEQGPEEPEIE